MDLLTLINETTLLADKLFDQELLHKKSQVQYKSRSKLISLRISKFLDLAAPLNKPEEYKIENIKGFLQKGEKIDSIPFLKTETEDGIAKVVGHEGRHRALVLKEMGYSYMPVEIIDQNIRWSEQEDPDSYDYVKQFPTKIEEEKGSLRMAFPFTREEAPKPYKV
jgi:hypothetical protein